MGIVRDLYYARKMSAGLKLPAPTVALLIKRLRLAAAMGGDITKTVSGTMVHITDALAKAALSVLASINPTQDLHGYANPWPAGGGKNLYDKSKAIVTGRNSRDLILGSPSSSDMADGSFVLPAGEYTVSVSEKMNVITVSNSASAIKTVYNKTEVTFTISELTPIKIQLTNTSATNGYWDGVSVQLESGSTATSWEPYENLCPISGLTGLSVYRTGKNLFDEAWEIGAISTTTGESVPSNASIRTANYIPLVGGQSYYWSWQSQQSLYMLLFTYHADKTLSRYVGAVTAQRTLTINSDEAFVRFYIYNDTTEPDWMQISDGSTATTYEPYNGNTYSVDWSTQAGTVYGGTVDVVTGVLNVTHSIIDLGNVNWSKDSNRAGVFYGAITGWKNASNVLACSEYTVRNLSVTTAVDMYVSGYCSYGGDYIFVRDTRFASNTAAEYKVGAAGIKVVYELATPLTYQLTPQEVQMLLGENYVRSSSGDTVSVTYYAEGNANPLQSLNILLGGRYSNPKTADDVSDKEALDIILGGNK